MTAKRNLSPLRSVVPGLLALSCLGAMDTSGAAPPEPATWAPVLAPWHAAAVHHVAVTPSGSVGLSVSGDGTLRTWQLRTMEQMGAMPAPPLVAKTGCIALSPLGNVFAMATPEGMDLVRTDTLQTVDRIEASLPLCPRRFLTPIRISVEGPQGIGLTERVDGEWLTHRWVAPPRDIRTSAHTPDGQYVLMGLDGECARFELHQVPGPGVEFEPPRKLAFGLDRDGKPLYEKRCFGAPGAISFSATQPFVAAATYDTAVVWDAREWTPVALLPHVASTPDTINLSLDGLAVSDTGDRVWTLWNQELWEWRLPHDVPFRRRPLPEALNTKAPGSAAWAVSTQPPALIWGGIEGTVATFPTEPSAPAKGTFSLGHIVSAMAFKPHSTQVAVSYGGTIALFDGAAFDRPVQQYNPADASATDLCWSEDGAVLAAAVPTKGLVVWHPKRTIWTQAGTDVTSVACSANGDVVFAGTSTGTLFAVQTSTGTARPFQSEQKGLVDIAVSPDGTWLATAGDYGGVRRWNVTTGEVVWTAEPAGKPVPFTAVAISPDGQSVVATQAFLGDNYTWRLGANDGATLSKFAGGDLGALATTFGPDGTIFVGHIGAQATQWDAKGKHQQARFPTYDGYASSIALSSDGNWFALGTSGNERSVRIWRKLPPPPSPK